MPSKCRYGRKVTGRRGCKSRPGPKRSRKSRVSSRRRRCARGVKRSPPRKGSCRRRPGPKKSRRVSRSRRASSTTSVRPNYQQYLYYIKGLNAWRVPRAGKRGTKKVVERNVLSSRRAGYLYFLKPNRNGTLSVHSRKMRNH